MQEVENYKLIAYYILQRKENLQPVKDETYILQQAFNMNILQQK